MNRQPGGTIYAIGAQGTPWVKIGYTTVPVAKRVQQLQTGQPFPLHLIAAQPVEADGQRIEKQVHDFLQEERRRGEWFEMPMDIAILEALIVRAVTALSTLEETPEMDDFPLGQRVLNRRRALHLTQQELATRCGFPYQIISRVERGHQDVYAQRLLLLATHLGVTTDYLLGLSDKERCDCHAGARPSDALQNTP